MTGFGYVRELVEGGPYDPNYELSDAVYAALNKRARALNLRGASQQERDLFLKAIQYAFERAREKSEYCISSLDWLFCSAHSASSASYS